MVIRADSIIGAGLAAAGLEYNLHVAAMYRPAEIAFASETIGTDLLPPGTSLEEDVTGMSSLTRNPRDDSKARYAARLWNTDLQTDTVISTPLISNGRFHAGNLAPATLAELKNNHVHTSGTLNHGYELKLPALDIKEELDAKYYQAADRESTRQASQTRWQNTWEWMLTQVAAGKLPTRADIDTMNLMLRYDDIHRAREIESLYIEWDNQLKALRQKYPDRTDPQARLAFGQELDHFLKEHTPPPRQVRFFRKGEVFTEFQKRRGQNVRSQFGALSSYELDFHIIDDTINDSTLHPVVRAAKVFQDLLTFHFYTDANGRTARLAMNWILLLSGLPPPWFEDTLCPANFEKYFECTADKKPILISNFDDAPTLLSDVVFEIWLGLQATQRILEEEGYAIDLGKAPLDNQDAIDTLTFVPWRHHFKEQPPITRRSAARVSVPS